ncbi:MAG: hypothetical protein RIB98_15015 [Acidimicrobiales bacterium]
MATTDTSPEIRRRVTAVFASMSGAQRVAHAAEMAEESKTIALAGIRSRHPGLTDAEVALEWVRLLHGDEIAGYAARCSSSS